MKHAAITTMTAGTGSIGQYGVDPGRYSDVNGGWPKTSRLLRILRTWLDRRRQRQALSMLDEHMRKDIGITAFDVVREAEKPFWQP